MNLSLTCLQISLTPSRKVQFPWRFPWPLEVPSLPHLRDGLVLLGHQFLSRCWIREVPELEAIGVTSAMVDDMSCLPMTQV